MSVGLPQDKATLDAKLGAVALQIRDALRGAQLLKAYLDTKLDTDLTTMSPGYTSGEVAQMRSAVSDLDKLRQIYEGTLAQTPAYDFRTFAKLITGVN